MIDGDVQVRVRVFNLMEMDVVGSSSVDMLWMCGWALFELMVWVCGGEAVMDDGPGW